MVNYLRESHFDDLKALITNPSKNKPVDRVDLDAKPLQKHIQKPPGHVDQFRHLSM